MVDIAPMTITDYDEVIALWQRMEGIGLHDFEDSREEIALYLERNPSMSFVARRRGKACLAPTPGHSGRLVGAVLCGHDGRRGSINHLAVEPDFRGHGIGRMLVDRCLSVLQGCGIRKCNIVVYRENRSGREVWSRLGWNEREDLVVVQCSTFGEAGNED